MKANAGDLPQGRFLLAARETRIKAGTARLDVVAILDRPGDPTIDLTVRWPDEDRRPTAGVGTISLSAIEQTETCDQTVFDPASLADGIGAPPEELFAARQPAYAISFSQD